MRFLRLCLAIPMLLASTEQPQHVAAKGPLVHLTSGTLEGALLGNIVVFEGVPFATPPVGALRWREPQPVASWSGVRDATRPSHPCVQNVAGTDNFIEPLAATYGVAFSRQTLDPSEDCLYLNVWTPQLQPGAHLPVLVWLHGGSNRVGSGMEPTYDGTILASHGVIVVTLNYRLGAMGFFSHPDRRQAGFGQTLKQFADLARPLYGNWTDITVATYTGLILLHGNPAIDQASNDILVACPVGAEAALTTSAGQRAFVYRFDRSVPGKGESELGAFHSLELPYVFGTFQARAFSWLPFTSKDHELSQIIETYWTNFAKFGDPNGQGLPHWTPWNTRQEPYLVFSQSCDAVPQQNFSPIYCHLSPDRLKQQLADF
jgi:carboxylesterase type B